MKRHMSALLGLVVLAAPAMAQHGGTGTGGGLPSVPAAARQFDFLIGEWELEVRPRVSSLAARLHGAPRLAGRWKAWRAFDGWGVEDEMRITNGTGDLQSLSHSMRVYDASAERWTMTNLDVMRARFAPSTAQWQGKEMVATAQATDQDGKAHTVRVRFHDITSSGFKWEQARSYDAGKSWEDPTLVITAKRLK